MAWFNNALLHNDSTNSGEGGSRQPGNWLFAPAYCCYGDERSVATEAAEYSTAGPIIEEIFRWRSPIPIEISKMLYMKQATG